MKHTPYTQQEISEAVSKSICYADVFRNLGITVNGGSYPWLKDLIKKFDVNCEHFLNPSDLRKRNSIKRKKRDYTKPLPQGYRLKNTDLKKHMNAYGIKYTCNACGISEWKGEYLILDIDHIDEDSGNNKLENLQYLCPNCHRCKTIKPKAKNKCKDCNREISKNATRCRSCGSKLIYKKRIEQGNENKSNICWRTPEEMQKLIKEHHQKDIAKLFGCSVRTLRNFCKKHSIDI